MFGEKSYLKVALLAYPKLHDVKRLSEIYCLKFYVQVANYCRDRIHSSLAEELEVIMANLNDGNSKDSCEEQWRRALTECFLKVDDEIGGKASLEPVAPETVGSTAVVAIVCSSHIIVANCGDSRAVLCRGKEPMALSVDHKVRM